VVGRAEPEEGLAGQEYGQDPLAEATDPVQLVAYVPRRLGDGVITTMPAQAFDLVAGDLFHRLPYSIFLGVQPLLPPSATPVYTCSQ
jgi:hypothetical protein